MADLELKRFSPVPGGVELLSICQGTCSEKMLSRRLHNLLLQRKSVRPVRVHTAGSDPRTTAFVHEFDMAGAETKSWIGNRNLKPATRGQLQANSSVATSRNIAGQQFAAICSVHSTMPPYHSLNTAREPRNRNRSPFLLFFFFFYTGLHSRIPCQHRYYDN